MCVPSWDFNSRPSARGDVTLPLFYGGRMNISIHAPPRGATGRYRAGYGGTYFNSRPSARGDEMLNMSITGRLFQFTPLREGRRSLCHVIRAGLYISIHAPPRGATCPCQRQRKPSTISIHAPPRGATPPTATPSHSGAISIHAPPRGATDSLRQRDGDGGISIHAPPRGATRRRRTMAIKP